MKLYPGSSTGFRYLTAVSSFELKLPFEPQTRILHKGPLHIFVDIPEK